MAKLSHTDSRRMYSWWWNSHISPKNSKWLQENLTDMDVKVKSMIKLIEEDADSFARRAEMYYKKRPELMKMVEEFYRAYRALAERYDNATGVIRQAHHTMSEAFPNQVPSMLSDDSPASSVSGTGPRTPDMLSPNEEFADALKQFSDPHGPVERVRRGLNFDELDEKEQSTHNIGNNHAKDLELSKPSREEEILVLKEVLAKLEAEKKAGLVQYQQSSDKLSQLETEISKTREDFRMLTDHANKAENEVSVLKEKLAALEAEKESRLQDYQKFVEKLNERAKTSEIEAQSLKGELDKLGVEKDAALDQYMHCLEIISNLENKLRVTEEDATGLKERVEKSESEVEILRQTISKLTVEKEAAARKYQQCLELISGLEQKLSSANEEIDNGFTKLKSSEEQCVELERSNRSLHSELESLMSKFGTQTQELSEKQKELGKLWACIQEERLRFVEAETAFQTLQHLHAQTQEELRAMASELQNRAHLLQVGETQNRSLQDEVMKVKEENKHLDEFNVTSSLSIKDMQNEISSLMESKGKLEAEVELRLDQRNALQQEIYCLKEELNDLSKKHASILDQVHELGLGPESLGSSVKELRDENSCLKEICQRESSEKAALLEKVEVLEQLLEKNSVLEMSLSDLNAELEAARGKIEALEQSCRSFLEEKSALLDEKAVLATQLQETNKNLNDLNEKHVLVLDQVHELGLAPVSLGSSVKELRDENSRLKETCERGSSEKAALLEKLEVLKQLLVKNSLLEMSLSDLNAELEAARGKIEALEQSCRSFLEEKSAIEDDKAIVVTQLQETNKNLEILSKNNTVLENFLSNVHHQLEVLKAKSKIMEDSCQLLVDEKAGLVSEKDGLASELENTRTRLEGLRRLYEELEGRCVNLEEEKESTRRKVDELNTSLEAERMEKASCIQTSEVKMRLLLDECRQKKGDLDQVLDSAIANELELFLLRTTSRALKDNNFSLLKMNQKLLEESDKNFLLWEHKNFEKQSELQSMKFFLRKAEEENLESSVELSVLVTWVRQLVIALQNLEMVKNNIEHEREALLTHTKGLNFKLKDMKRENSDISEEKRSLLDNIRHLEGKTNVLEEENFLLCSKVLALENLSLIFRIFVDEKFTVFREISDDRNKFHDFNATLIGKLEESKSQNVNLMERLHNTEDQLIVEIESGKKLLNQMTLQLQEAAEKIHRTEKQKLELNEIVGTLRKEMQREKSVISEEKRSLMDNIRHLEGKTNILEEENYVLCSKVLALENLSLIFRIFADEKLMVFREIGDDRNKLYDVNASLIGKLEESKIENVNVKERLHRTEDQLSVEIESGKKLLNRMALQLQEAEEKISLAENEKVELNDSVENLTKDYNVVKTALGHQENRILKLSADNDNLSRENNFLREASEKLGADLEKLRREHNAKKIEEENLCFELQKKVNEINELEILGASIFGQLNHSGVSQLIYEHKFHELSDVFDGYMDQNVVLKSQLAAYGPEIVLLKESISSLENHTDIHIKFPNPENEELQDVQVTNDGYENILNEDCDKSMISSGAADLHNLTARLQAIVKAAAELKDLMVQENTSLHSKLDDTIKQLESLQSNQNGRHRRSRRPTSEITSEGENILLTKDIVLDQISDGSTYGLSKRQQQQPFDADNQMVELWETSDPDGTVGLTVSKSKKIAENNNLRRLKSMKKQKSILSTTSDGLSMEKLELLKGSSESFGEGNNRTKVLERLDSDVQKLANLQITVQDLKRKLEVTEKGKRGKAVIECEALKGQLEEADVAVVKLFELNERLVKSIDDRSFSDKSSFDLENDGRERRRRVSKQAQRMSEKIGRLQLEVQRLQFVLLKMDEVKDGKSRTMSESKRRVLLRDYLYGVGQRRKKKTAQFCGCVQPSTVED